ncbi:unnamed protein product [Ixodes persulcatus]
MSAASMSIRPVVLLLLACSITVCTSGALAPGREVLRAPTKQVIKNYFATDRTRALTSVPVTFAVIMEHVSSTASVCTVKRAHTSSFFFFSFFYAQDATGSFTNSLTIRFHPSLELEGDEIKTLVCKFTTGEVNLG